MIRFVSHQTELLFGYDRDDLVGAPAEMLVPESVRAAYKVHREGYVAAPPSHGMGTDLEMRGKRRDGTQFPVDIALSHTDTDDGPLVIAAVRDVTEQVRAQREVVERLAELERFQRLTVGRELKMIELKTEIADRPWRAVHLTSLRIPPTSQVFIGNLRHQQPPITYITWMRSQELGVVSGQR